MPLPTDRWRSLIEAICADTPPVPPDILEAMVIVESNGDPNARSASNAIGLGQIIPRWHGDTIFQVAHELSMAFSSAGDALLDPELNLRVAARHLRWCETACGSWETAVAKYHSGQCHPPADFVDGQGTSTVYHLVKFRAALQDVRDTRATTQETTTMTPYILNVSGHRSTGDEGNPAERARTDELASTYTDVFRDAGFESDWWQRDLDTDRDRDMTVGDLDTVALGVARVLDERATSHPDQLAIMFDHHYNGGHSVVHAIVADNIGLVTGYPQGRNGTDTAANNTLDVRMGQAIAEAVVDATGLGLYSGWRLGKPGVMSERDTGVAIQFSARLAMLSASAPSRMTAARFVLEHAGYNDAETKQTGFERRCAEAALKAVIAVMDLGDVETTVPKPEVPTTPDIAFPAGMDLEIATWLFDQVTGDDGWVYGFNAKGVISNRWLERGTQTGQFPALVAVRNVPDGDVVRKYFQFSNGEIDWQPDRPSGFELLGK